MKPLTFILLILSLYGCSRSVFKSKWTNQKSPASFVARFETSKGSFDVEVKREWSPMAADRFYQLVKHRFYNDGIFYRVDKKFVAQFGTSDTIKSSKWDRYKIPDEPVMYGNKKGSISFARGDKETRGRDIYINLTNNQFLDTLNYSDVKGFPAFGNVTRGMEVVESLYSGYNDSTMTQLEILYKNRPAFLKIFPKLDAISHVSVLKLKQ